jgi:molecular chaperone GrpE
MSKDQPKSHKAPKLVKTELLEQQIIELTAALQRERADTINIRRQHDEQVANLKTMVKANVVRDLLPVIDNIERALQHIPDDLEGNEFIAGIERIAKQFAKVLSDIGVERIKTVGEPFDPRFHEAVSMEEGEGSLEVVCEELQAGYRINDDVIRHAMVKVKMQ